MVMICDDGATGEEPTGTVERQHPLANWIPDNIKNWDEWLAEWHKTHRQEVREGLLHCGPNIHGWDIGFYLEIADGHSESSGYPGGGPRSDARRQLAQKAFSVLCQRVFKIGSPNFLSWLDGDEAERILEAIFWFFGVEPPEWEDAKVSNLADKKHEKELMDEFFDRFLKYLWDLINRSYSRDELDPPRLVKFRPQLLRLIWGLKRFDFFRNYGVDDADMEILKDFALECRITLPGRDGNRRKAATVEEATYGGSRAAETYLLLKVKREVRARLEAEANAKAAQEEVSSR